MSFARRRRVRPHGPPHRGRAGVVGQGRVRAYGPHAYPCHSSPGCSALPAVGGGASSLRSSAPPPSCGWSACGRRSGRRRVVWPPGGRFASPRGYPPGEAPPACPVSGRRRRPWARPACGPRSGGAPPRPVRRGGTAGTRRGPFGATAGPPSGGLAATLLHNHPVRYTLTA